MTQVVDDLVWRPLSGPGARSEAEQVEFIARRAADGKALIDRFGISPNPARRGRCPAKVSTLDGSITIRRALTNPVGQVAHLRASSDAETSGDEVSGAIDVVIPGALDRSTDSIWRAERDLGLAEIARELRRRTRNPGDRERLARGIAGAAVAFDWQYLFGSQTSFTAQKLRRIVEALQGNAARPTKPRSDNRDQMWHGFPREAIVPVQRYECFWALGLQDPTPVDVRLPPPAVRQPTLRQDGLYEYHCLRCRRHDRDVAGNWLDPEDHWGCEIHQQILSICDVRLPFVGGVRPAARIIRAQVIEADPVLAPLLKAAVDDGIAAGSIRYAGRFEPWIIVPSRGVYK